MHKYFLMVVFLFVGLGSYAGTAADYLKKADVFNKQKDYQQALQYYQLAEQEEAKSGFYSARKGQFYHYSMKDYPKAIEAFQEAYRKGFLNGWMFTQAGNSYKNLNDLENAKKWYQLGIQSLSKQIKERQQAKKDVKSLKNSLLTLYSQYCSALVYFKDFIQAEAVGRAGLALDPATKNFSLLNSLARALHWRAMENFGNSKAKEAMEQLQFASELAKRDGKIKKALYSEFQTLIKVCQNRLRYSSAKPLYTHKILVILIPRTDATDDKNQVHLQSEISSLTGDATLMAVKFLKEFIEASTQGQIAISYKVEKSDWVLKRVQANLAIETSQRKNKTPDLNSLTREHESFFKEKMRDYDTFVLVWSAKDFNVANGGMRKYQLPASKLALWRGYSHIPSERMLINGPDLLLHEFFHTVERMVGLPVQHGYYDTNRHNYPAWQGENGNDYYFWQLSANIPKLLREKKQDYSAFNFRLKYPLKK